MTDEHSMLTDRLRLAQEIVDKAAIKGDLRPAAFEEILRVLDSSALEPQQRSEHEQRRPARVRTSRSKRLAAVAEALEVDESVVEPVFADEDGELKFVLPPRRLTNTTRGAMRQIAILTVCARQAGWDESWTTAEEIRAMCQSVGVISKHFSEVVSNLGMFSTTGSGNNRRLRAHPGSYEAARQVLIELGVLQASEAA